MAVYVDWAVHPFRGQKYCHCFADSVAELHALADRIGCKRSWFQNKPHKIPHYDLSPSMRAKAIRAGAIEITDKQVWLAKYREIISSSQNTESRTNPPISKR